MRSPAWLGMGVALLFGADAAAQSGSVERAVGGYSFSDAAQEHPDTRNFHSADGHLTFAIVTQTAGNGFFDPLYVGAKAAANLIGAEILLLGSESSNEDVARQIEILSQIVQDPLIDGIIMTTPQAGAYDDIVRTALRNGIPVATTNSFDATLLERSRIGHTGQDASAAAIAGEALVRCLVDRGIAGGTIVLPSSTAAGNVEVNNRVAFAFNAIVAALHDAGRLADFTVDAGPHDTGIDLNPDDPVAGVMTLLESRGDVVGAFAGNALWTPAIAQASAQLGLTGELCAFGFDLGPAQQEALKSGDLTGTVGQQPFLQGFWPVMQLYLQIDRGISAANLDTRAQLVTQETVGQIGTRYEN